ncbi:MAG: hypothetical protein WC457_03435 [Patescibacteria group bacterium]
MFLLIDNSNDEAIIFYWREQKKIITVKNRSSKQSLLAVLETSLKKHQKNISDLTGIAVVVGLGRFTATRVATTTANTLGFALKIPVVSVDSADYELAEKLLRKKRVGIYISAKYSGEAHVGGAAS